MNKITNALNTSAYYATMIIKLLASIATLIVLTLLYISAIPLVAMLCVTFVVYNMYRFFTYRTRISFREFIINAITNLKDSIEK